MNINSLNLYNVFQVKKSDTQTKPPLLLQQKSMFNISPLAKDTVSFKGSERINKNTQKVKKADFNPTDRFVVEKFRVNISGFKSVDDLQKWAEQKIKKEYVDKNLDGHQEETAIARKSIMSDWLNYVTKENSAYTPTIQLLILDAITKDIKTNNDTIPPALNRGVLAESIQEMSDRLKANPKDEVNLNKLYRTKLKALYLSSNDNSNSNNDYTGWVVIPSKEHDPEHFDDNVGKLKEFSHQNWCTKSFNAEPYLAEGDFHVYMEHGTPKLGVRFVGDKIEEIQGQRNNSKIPLIHLEKIQDYIQDNNFDLHKKALNQIAEAVDIKDNYLELCEQIGEEAIKNNDPEKILPVFGMNVKKTKDGMYIVDKYHQPSGNYGFEDFGIDENAMFSKIKIIKGDADFDNSSLSEIKGLETIGGNVNILFSSKLKSLGSLKTIKGSLSINDSLIEDLGDLEYIGNNVNFGYTNLLNTGKLKYIGGTAQFGDSKIESLGKIEKIKGNLRLTDSNVSDLGELRHIGGSAYFKNSIIESLGKLESIGLNACFEYSSINDLGALKYIGEDADFSGLDIQNIYGLEHVGGYIDITDSNIDDEDIEYLRNDKIEDDDVDIEEYIDKHKSYNEICSMEDFERFLERGM